jgi:hypothetical protein
VSLVSITCNRNSKSLSGESANTYSRSSCHIGSLIFISPTQQPCILLFPITLSMTNPFAGMKHLWIPAGAFSYSSTSGAPFPRSHNGSEASPLDGCSPRAVSEEYFKPICSWWKTIHLSASRTTEALRLDVADGDFLTDRVA